MIIVMRHDATSAQVAAVVSQVQAHGMRTHLSDGDERTVIGVIGTNPFALRDLFVEAPGVAEVVPITKPFKLSNREFRSRDTRIRVNSHEVGGEHVWIVAGPCSVDNEELYLETCRRAHAAGAHALQLSGAARRRGRNPTGSAATDRPSPRLRGAGACRYRHAG